MKHNKSILALLLALALMLCACGGESKQEDVAGNLTPVQTEAPAETEAPVETTAPAQEKDVSMGILEGGTYSNPYAGFGFTLDESWTIYPAEMLQELPENVREMFEGTDYENVELNQFTDVMAENVDELLTMNVLYQKVSLQERLAYAVMDDSDLMDGILTQYDTLVQAYANGGINVESMEKKNVTFLGEERVALYTVATMQDVPYYILQIYDYDLGEYAIITTFGSYFEDNTESMLELFYTVE